ncbi:hypothetical protein E2C01_055996 [Portunus trituberculatus]|uniref:Uncharacterized protein n=1 Tax=Portunus trituberculatus TaxID=210409 RepID=A0A5B7GWP6_PORTR|nr:hypothetical protein [Portunus trituberculatus]
MNGIPRTTHSRVAQVYYQAISRLREAYVCGWGWGAVSRRTPGSSQGHGEGVEGKPRWGWKERQKTGWKGNTTRL